MQSPANPPFFNPWADLRQTRTNLPHWRQDAVLYFITFRLADSLPKERLDAWTRDRNAWLASHPKPHSPAETREFHATFSARLEEWLDQAAGSCVLAIPECHAIVRRAIIHFDGKRLHLGDFVVAANHVHVLANPLPGHDLSAILHSWKSFTAKQIVKVQAAARRLEPWWNNRASKWTESGRLPDSMRPVWQKESFDHIVRSPEDLQRFETYIRSHPEWKRRPAA